MTDRWNQPEGLNLNLHDTLRTAAYTDRGLEAVHRKEKLFSDAAKMEIFKRTHSIARPVN